MTAMVGVQCDSCGAQRTDTTWSRAAFGPFRERMARLGWVSRMRRVTGTTIRIRHDWCPVCVAAGKHRPPGDREAGQ